MSVRHLFRLFPNLDPARFSLTSSQTPTYNCIAYAAGDLSRWWWPDPDGLFFWPVAAQRVERLAAFQQAFESIGYALTGDASVQPGLEKVALFAKGSAPSHAARQLKDGSWSSKLGRLEDISHHLEGVEGVAYGTSAIFMCRRRR